ncbi:cobalamin biosynthesis protein CbiD [Propionibacterium sp. oral taxon 192 str. F0372]|uniref:cobalt-precorrin-5B (C(1))-methyltransferase n=1 Tax=Propionibacterium sp. oral taxon 192 TaxID=671222 RepID=UPI0003527A54|nr:cobalt-precorrin-5B (C(1))-methyltransferase [Propionibacterium sp. oral taxon 192]EPH03790.1 cobalamin biosynthesis protein CbiD [Propionibacterium sp. oral taxon 192 str. F0372]
MSDPAGTPVDHRTTSEASASGVLVPAEPNGPAQLGVEPGGGSQAGGRRGQLESSKLRPGWTTGACAAAGARAAYAALLTGEFPDPVTVDLPQHRSPAFALTKYRLDEAGFAEVCVTKDAGDDPDVTHGAIIRTRVYRGSAESGIVFRAGHGVGTVTLPGLPLEIGQPAINPMPRGYITRNLRAAAGLTDGDPDPDVVVEVGVDHGEELARKTMNPRLGIIGGISVLGTTGVVVPYSCAAWIDSIRRGVDVAKALGHDHVAGCTGSTSEKVVRSLYGLPETSLLDMGDFVGAVLTYLKKVPLPRLTICGGIGKLAKLADGHLDLHSARSRVDLDFLATLARDNGASDEVVEVIPASQTALGAYKKAKELGFDLATMIAEKARQEALAVLAGAPVATDIVVIDRAGNIVGRAG